MADQHKTAGKKLEPIKPPENKVLAFMKESLTVPEYQQMMNYLMDRRAVPEVKKGALPYNVFGEFATNVWSRGPLPKAGRVTLGPGAGTDTLIHEITHAVERQIIQQYAEDPKRGGPSALLNRLFGDPNQFVDGYEKLVYNAATQTRQGEEQHGDQRSRLMNKMNPDWARQGSEYRSSPGEAVARSVENMTARGGAAFDPGPDHVDATLATEFLIILDLAQREQAKKPQSQGR